MSSISAHLINCVALSSWLTLPLCMRKQGHIMTNKGASECFFICYIIEFWWLSSHMKWPVSRNTRERTDYFHFPVTLYYQMISFFWWSAFVELIYCLIRLQGMVSFQGLVVGCLEEKGSRRRGEMRRRKQKETAG